ncbi:MAG: enoyl-CoA hydratase-related protein [Phycisphaerales bacterium]
MAIEPLPILTAGDAVAPGVSIVRLEQPGRPVVVIDAALLDRLDATLDALPADAAGVVFASASERVFVAGADLKAIMALSDGELDDYLARGQRIFGRIASLPCPTAAAINGAALGGGLELAMHCDGLIGAPGAKPYPVGLPEAGLGICPGWGGTNLLPARIDPLNAIQHTADGKTMLYADAVEASLFDATVEDASDLVNTAAEWASKQDTPERDGAPSRWIGRDADTVRRALDDSGIETTATGRAVAACIAAGLGKGWQAALDAEREQLVALRGTEAAQQSIEAFFARAKAGKA